MLNYIVALEAGASNSAREENISNCSQSDAAFEAKLAEACPYHMVAVVCSSNNQNINTQTLV